MSGRRPVVKEQKITLDIHDLNHQGDGVGKYDNFAIFVPQALPGERIRAAITEVKKNFARAEVLQYCDRAANRVEPPCPYFFRCGGCQLQHLSYNGQLQYKYNLVVDQMKKVAGIKNPKVQEVIGMDYPWYYRNKIQIPVKSFGSQLKMGLFQKNSHNLVEIDHCMIQQSGNNQIINRLRELMNYYQDYFSGVNLKYIVSRVGEKTGQMQVTFVTDKENFTHYAKIADNLTENVSGIVSIMQNINKKMGTTIMGDKFRTLWGRSYLIDKLLEKKFRISAGAFYQVNSQQTEVLYQKLFDLCQLKGDGQIVDLYCGIGTITILAAEKAKRVTGIEVSPSAVQDAQINGDINGITNIDFYRSKAEDPEIKSLLRNMNPELVIMDPPRKGCDQQLFQTIDLIKPEQIAYVSCNPATMARDVLQLVELGYYPEIFQPVDMFPQTTHVEVIGIFNKIQYQ